MTFMFNQNSSSMIQFKFQWFNSSSFNLILSKYILMNIRDIFLPITSLNNNKFRIKHRSIIKLNINFQGYSKNIKRLIIEIWFAILFRFFYRVFLGIFTLYSLRLIGHTSNLFTSKTSFQNFCLLSAKYSLAINEKSIEKILEGSENKNNF